MKYSSYSEYDSQNDRVDACASMRLRNGRTYRSMIRWSWFTNAFITVPTGKFASGPYQRADSNVSAPPFPPVSDFSMNS
jgi:hypothetical protein